jgi:hypothetical protein
MAWAMDQTVVANPTARHVLLVLANYADVKGKAAFPSAETIVRQTGLSERSVRNKLVELEEIGAIVRGNQAIVQAYIDRGDRRPVCYDILMNQDEKRGAADAPRTPRGARGSSTGCTSFQNGVQEIPERGAGDAPNPPINPSVEPSVNRMSRAARTTRSGNTKKTRISEDFEISERVRNWASKNGHTNLERHFAAFVTKCRAKGYQYESWDDAFMEAIREDWAGLSKRTTGGKNDRSAAAAAIFPTINSASMGYIDV